jgi:hypothetical protein
VFMAANSLRFWPWVTLLHDKLSWETCFIKEVTLSTLSSPSWTVSVLIVSFFKNLYSIHSRLSSKWNLISSSSSDSNPGFILCLFHPRGQTQRPANLVCNHIVPAYAFPPGLDDRSTSCKGKVCSKLVHAFSF